MTSLQNQIIKYGKKHIGSAKGFFFFCPWKGSGRFAIPHLRVGFKLHRILPSLSGKIQRYSVLFPKDSFSLRRQDADGER